MSKNELSQVKLRQSVKMLIKMLAIPGPSGEEGEIVAFVIDRLRAAGAPASAIRTDNAHRRSPIGGQVGNLILKLPGRGKMARSPRRMLMGHVDTVSLCVGCKPVDKGRKLAGGFASTIVSADPNTALGADNRTGAAVVLVAALHLLEQKPNHPPLTFFWTVQEEVGLHGSEFANLPILGRPKLAFNFDGGSSAKLTIGATGAYRMTITIDGVAAHAGMRPSDGVNAATIAGIAIASLQRGGWLGAVYKRGPAGGRGTSNIGTIDVAGATNVVPNLATLEAEVRSHDKRFRKRMLREVCDAFKSAANTVRNASGKCGKASIDARLDYESFLLKASEPCVQVAGATIRTVGAKPIHAVVDGGLDANWLSPRDIPTVTLGAGQRNQHMVTEALDVADFLQGCRIGLRLATGQDQ